MMMPARRSSPGARRRSRSWPTAAPRRPSSATRWRGRSSRPSPDPALAVDAPALVTIDGENLGGGLGDSGALLGALNVSIVREVKDGALRTEVVVPVGAAGGALVYRECGAASEPRPLRVIGPSLGAAPVSLPSACAVAALAPEPDEAAVLVAFACDDQAKSYVQRFRAGPAATVCPLDGDEIWHLAQRPTALAPGWVGLDGGGVARFAPTVAGDAGPPEGSGRVSVMALAETGVYGLIDGRVAKVDAAQRVVGGIDAGLALVDLVAVPGGLAALAGSGGVAGEGRIVSISGADDRVDTLSLPECHGPRALAGDAARFVVACDDGLVVYARADKTVKVLSDVRAARVALDPRGDVAFAWDPGVGASAIDLGAGSVLHAWAQTDDPPTPLLLALDLDPAQATLGLLATTGAGDALTLWTPYDAEGLCR
ncbi:MAG: hypothetical protein U1F43_17845 [Myxococcota bacterium]